MVLLKIIDSDLWYIVMNMPTFICFSPFCMFLFIGDFILYSISHPTIVLFFVLIFFISFFYTMPYLFSVFLFCFCGFITLFYFFLHRIVNLIQLVVFNYVFFYITIFISDYHVFSFAHVFRFSVLSFMVSYFVWVSRFQNSVLFIFFHISLVVMFL